MIAGNARIGPYCEDHMSLPNQKIVKTLEQFALEFSSWPAQELPAGEGREEVFCNPTPYLPTRWGFITGARKGERGEPRRSTSVQFFVPAINRSSLPRVRARSAAVIWNELRQLEMHLKGVRVEQSDKGELFSLAVSYSDEADQRGREGDLVDFLIVMFVANRIDDIVEVASGVDNISMKFLHELQYFGASSVHLTF